MRNVVGNPVSGMDFYGREDELRRLDRTIRNGNHVLLKAPRRVGKSSLMAEFARLLRGDNWAVAESDVQQCEDEASFLECLYRAIQKSDVTIPADHEVGALIKKFRSLLRGTSVKAKDVSVTFGSDADVGWEQAATSLGDLIPRLAIDREVLITLDELPIFLAKLLRTDDGTERVRRVLDWLRSVRQACGSKVLWILCGSIGLDSFVENQGLEGTINELTGFPLDAFTPEDASGLLQKLAEHDEEIDTLSNEVIDDMINRVGWPIPYYLQLLFHELMTLPMNLRSDSFPSTTDVETAYQAATQADSLGHWASRLNDSLEPSAISRVKLLLSTLARNPAGLTTDDLMFALVAAATQTDADTLKDNLRQHLRLLEDEGYLIHQDGSWAFRSFLLRDYWHRRFCM